MRMRVELVPLNPTVGDLKANGAMVARAAVEGAARGAALVVVPELAVCGYPPKDVLGQSGFIEACMRASDEAGSVTGSAGVTLVMGTPWRDERGLVRNALVTYRGGRRIGVYAKRLLPTYDVFDEDRYFVAGDEPGVIEVPHAGGVARVGLTICEDLWRGEDAGFSSRYAGVRDPVEDLARAGCGLIVSPSASPFVLGKTERHRAIVRAHAARHGVVVASVNQLGGNDDLVFDGHAFAFGARGDEVVRGELFAGAAVGFEAEGRGGVVAERSAEWMLYHALVTGVKDYLRKTGFRGAVLGLSGGIDSALTAVIACAAVGAGNVRGVAMPSRYSSDHSKSDACDLAERLGMRCDMVPIEEAFGGLARTLDAHFAGVGMPRLGEVLPDLTEENLQSRIRGTILMGISNRTGAIVLTTGNKSELAVGYCTLYGDMNGGLAVLSDVTKQWVYRLSRWINDNHAACGFAVPPIPEGSITKAPSAELRPGQTDQDSLPPYDVLDAIIDAYVEQKRGEGEIVAMGFDRGVVARVLRLIDLSEYKRKQAATGLKVTTVAFGSGRRWPIAMRRGW
jgi:NAD+ synthetase